ncbi:hypothetical protein [Actinomadura rubrisoli]|uniref:Uncharacterized protein n=1 Tax=Actinomadura rubrisoli TaxID=2530368 RepID=A0A4R5A1F6_9ACTN|nr:hypothetical protein [Actinomadura rubrisoli]TDD64760.1 hypothetical protein E1298_42050 [Actinomadura rubrisoli]
MAYFVLPGRGKRAYRLAIARRIVDGTARRDRSPAGLARRRTRVLRRAMRPSRRLQVGLGPWLRAVPGRLPDPGPTGALARLDPPVRAAYVLRHMLGMPRYAVHDQLIEVGVRHPWPVIEAADALEVPAPRRPEWPEPALLRPVRHRSLLPLATAAALTAGLVGALVMTESDGSLAGGSRSASAHGLRLVTAPPAAWTRAAGTPGARTLDAWPARGGLVRDRAITRRALDAWARATGDRRAQGGTAQLLYAGHVGGAPLVLLRSGDRLARYARQSGLEVVAAGADPSAPIHLGGGRYLLAPWDTRPETLAGDGMELRDGVIGPALARTRCGRGPILHLQGPDGSRTVGDLGGPRAAVLAYHSPAYRPSAAARAAAAKGTVRLGREGVRFWERLGCRAPRPARPVTEATAWDFWSGTLPHGGTSADWVCTRLAFPGGGADAQATLLGEREQYASGACDDRRPVSGTWWRAPSGGWYYLAAAARGLVPRAEGPVRSSGAEERLLVAEPVEPVRRGRRPAVRLTAVPPE